MSKVSFLSLALIIYFLLIFYVGIGYSTEPVVIEFLYRPGCTTCKGWEKFYEIYLYNNDTLNNIQRDYGSEVSICWILFNSHEGYEKWNQYNLSVTDWNSIIVDYEVVANRNEKANETYIRELIDYFLGVPSDSPPSSPPSQTPPPPPSSSKQLSFIAAVMVAFSFGFVETFSPCLIIMLSFVLSYTIGSTSKFKESFFTVMIFGVGFLLAALLLGLAFGLVFLSMPMLQVYLMWIVCIFAVIFGLSLLGLLKVPIETKPLIMRLSRKYVATYTGMFILGFVFYFLDPCIAPVFIAMAPFLLPNLFSLVIFVFCLGVMAPFFGIGIFAGSVSKVARSTYRHRFLIRAISGLILIGYAIYFILTYLL